MFVCVFFFFFFFFFACQSCAGFCRAGLCCISFCCAGPCDFLLFILRCRAHSKSQFERLLPIFVFCILSALCENFLRLCPSSLPLRNAQILNMYRYCRLLPERTNFESLCEPAILRSRRRMNNGTSRRQSCVPACKEANMLFL